MHVRLETLADEPAIREANLLAFGQEAEGRLVDELRAGGFVRLSLVAEDQGRIVGHVLFSDLPIQTTQGMVSALALAPVAVVPWRQRQGIGSALIQQGLQLCRRQGHRIVVVLGHPDYYPRFGFSSELAQPLACVFHTGPALMALELVSGSLQGVRGELRYPPPFLSL
jgi:putative acetyltransferase